MTLLIIFPFLNIPCNFCRSSLIFFRALAKCGYWYHLSLSPDTFILFVPGTLWNGISCLKSTMLSCDVVSLNPLHLKLAFLRPPLPQALSWSKHNHRHNAGNASWCNACVFLPSYISSFLYPTCCAVGIPLNNNRKSFFFFVVTANNKNKE